MPAEELTVVGGLQKREAQGEKKKEPEDSAFVPITANPFSCRESGDPLLARADSTELCREESLAPTHPTPDRRESQELSSVFCLCVSSAFSDENVPLFRA